VVRLLFNTDAQNCTWGITNALINGANWTSSLPNGVSCDQFWEN